MAPALMTSISGDKLRERNISAAQNLDIKPSSLRDMHAADAYASHTGQLSCDRSALLIYTADRTQDKVEYECIVGSVCVRHDCRMHYIVFGDIDG